MGRGGAEGNVAAAGTRSTSRQQVISSIEQSPLVELTNPDQPQRYLIVHKIDVDSLSDRRATYCRDEAEASLASLEKPTFWWPDCVIDLDAPLDRACRNAAAGDGSFGEPYPFGEDHVIFA